MSGGNSEKLLERMENTQSGWGQNDFEKLFVGYGFNFREGKKHTIYWHPVYLQLKISVPRHNDLKPWVAREAIKLIAELNKISVEEKDGTTNKRS